MDGASAISRLQPCVIMAGQTQIEILHTSPLDSRSVGQQERSKILLVLTTPTPLSAFSLQVLQLSLHTSYIDYSRILTAPFLPFIDIFPLCVVIIMYMNRR